MQKGNRNYQFLLVLGLVVLLAGLSWGCGGNKAETPVPEQNAATAKSPAASSAQTPAFPSSDSKGTAQPKPGAKAKDTKPIKKVSVASIAKLVIFLPEYLGVAKGIFAAEGLDVELVTAATNVIVAGITSGSIDYSTVAGSTLRGAMDGLPIKLVAYSANQPDFFLFAKPEIKSVEQLKGRIVASGTPVSTDTLALFAALNSKGVTQKDVQWRAIAGAPDRFAAMEAGQVDATVLGLPLNVVAENKGYTMLADAGKILGLPFVGLGTATEKIKSHPDEVKNAIRAMLKSVDYIIKNKKEAADFISKEWKISETDANKVYDTLIPMLTPNGLVLEESIKKDIDNYKKVKSITKEVPLDLIADFSLLREVQQEMGIK